MSADIWLVNDDGDQEIIADDADAYMREMVPMRYSSSYDAHSVNLTYNLSPMLWAAGMPSWSEMMGMRAEDAGAIWEAVVEELERDPEAYRLLNPPNGWGTYEGAIESLRVLVDACQRYPSAKVDGSL